MLEGRGADIHQAYCQGFPHFSKETKRPKNQIKEQYFRFFSVGSVPSFPSFSSNTKSPFPLPGKTDISSPASSIAFSSPCPHVLCLVCPASLEQSASFRQVHGGHLVTHCQPCCSPSVPPVRCVSGMTHALYQTWSMPDMHEGHSHTHTYTDHAKDQFRQVSLTWFFFFFSFFIA